MSRVKFKYINMSHWGHICILPHLDLCVTYSQPTLMIEWWIWRIDIEFWYRFPDWGRFCGLESSTSAPESAFSNLSASVIPDRSRTR